MGNSASSPAAGVTVHKGPEEVFACDEEPVFLTAKQGFGFYPITLGQKFCEGRYEILRKLGWGQSSTVWLARDARSDTFVAVKVLTANATAGFQKDRSGELPILQRVTAANPSHPGFRFITPLLDHFTIESAQGNHLCLTTQVLGTSVNDLRRAQPRKAFRLPTAKRVIKQILYALDYLHRECGVIHTDLKPDNMMIFHGQPDAHIRAVLRQEPSRLYPERVDLAFSPDPIRTVVSQPIPLTGVREDGRDVLIKVADLGHATWASRHFNEEIQPYTLRAPEVVLGHPWSTPVDIWSLGCLTFEFLTGACCIDPEQGKTFSLEDDILARIMELTGESFPSSMLSQSSRAILFFDPEDPTRSLRRIKNITPLSIEAALRNYHSIESMSDQDINGVARFMRRCLCLEPSKRASAAELLQDEWLGDVDL